MDLVGGLVGLIVLAPLLIFIGIMVALALGRPILFRQQRPGLDGRPFTLLKFRTMRPPAPGADPVAADGDRLTRFGRWLRSTSLDELPELINVVRGEMSLVGPRPLLTEYLALYTKRQARRHEVRPGITGLAQVRGRNELTWEERFELDVYYVDNWSLLLDFRIMMETVKKVLAKEGVNRVGEATMTRFRGSSAEDET